MVPPRFYCYVTMDRREDGDLLASKMFMRVSDGSSIRVQHFVARSERKSGKDEQNSESFDGFEGSEGISGSQNAQHLAVKIGLDSRTDITSGNQNSIQITTESKSSIVVPNYHEVRQSTPSDIFKNRQLGFRRLIGQSIGVEGCNEFANSQYIKIRQSLSISKTPSTHDSLWASGLRFNIRNL